MNTQKNRYWFATAAISALFAPIACAIEAIRIDSPIILDGKLDDSVWLRAPVMDKFYENMPNEKQPARERTEVRVLYDADALYVGVRAFDREPSKIVAPWVRRDKVFGTMDNFNLWIDPTGAKKFAQFFRVSVRGMLADGSWSEDASDESFAPDYDYQAVSALLSDGWSAEFRIPWSALRVPSPTPEQLNILVFRNSRRETRVRDSNVPLTRDPACFLCVAEPLTGIKNIPAASGFEVSPYATIGASKTAGDKQTSDWNAGLDLKWRVNSSWVVDGTFRPDFSQLELDTPQLRGNTRFALGFPEKRAFFLEGSDLYGTPFGLTYTRAIADPRWGARATTRSESYDATVLTVADKGGAAIFLPNAFYTDVKAQPESQVTYARLRAPLRFGESSGAWGAMVSDRRYQDDTRNTVASIEGNWKISNPARVRAQMAHSETQDFNLTSRGHVAYVDGLYDADGVHFFAKALEISPNFRADGGAIFQNNIRELFAEAWKCTRREGFVYEICPGLMIGGQRTLDGQTTNADVWGNVYMNGNKNLEFSIQPHPFRATRTRDGGALHRIPYFATNLGFFPSEIWTLYGVNLDIGRFADTLSDTVERGASFGQSVNFRPHARIEIETSMAVFMLRTLDDNVLKLRESYAQIVGIGHLSAHQTLRLVSQFTQSIRNPAAYPTIQSLGKGARGNVHSLTLTHKWGLNKEFNVGMTTQKQSVIGTGASTRTTEGFAKVVWSFNR